MSLVEVMWGAMGESPDLLPWLSGDGQPAPLPCPLPVGELAMAAVQCVAAQAALLDAECTGSRERPRLFIDRAGVAAAYSSEALFQLNGVTPTAWADLSGFFPARRGWVRTHANYPHHRAALLAMLGLGRSASRDDAAAALRRREPYEWEERAAHAGAVVGAVRSAPQWRAHRQAQAVAARAVLTISRSGGPGAPRHERAYTPVPGAPLAGMRVLDLTRVIAGPVATRTLAYLGADVLRVDSPRMPEIAWQHLATGQGKRTALVDGATPAGAATLDHLLAGAHVLVTGYRPGSLARLGLDPAAVARHHPGLVVAQISAFSDAGPWGARRGFDSIVQAVTGIALACSPDGVTPGALPVQALDHSAGYLLAAGVLRAVRARHRDGVGRLVRVNLARLAQELLWAQGRETAGEVAGRPGDKLSGEELAAHLVTAGSPAGRQTYPAPAFTYAGGPAAYPFPAHEWGADPPAW